MGRFDCFIYFFVLQETQKETSEAVSLDVFLMNGYKITVKIMSTDQTEDVLEVYNLFIYYIFIIVVITNFLRMLFIEMMRLGMRIFLEWGCLKLYMVNFLGILISSTNKNGCHVITEMSLKVTFRSAW